MTVEKKAIRLSEIFNGDVDKEAVREIFERVGANLAGYMMESQRIDEQGKVKLYDRLIEDMKLKPGDLMVFVQNEQGHWEVRRAEEIAGMLKAAWEPVELPVHENVVCALCGETVKGVRLEIWGSLHDGERFVCIDKEACRRRRSKVADPRQAHAGDEREAKPL